MLKIIFLIFAFSSHAQTVCKTKLQKYFMLNIYKITLCKEKTTNYESLFSSTFSITLEYQRNFAGKEIAKRSIQEIEKNHSITKQEKASYLKAFAIFPNVKKGDSISMQYTPNGAVILYNGNKIGEFQNQILSKRFAQIWLHPNSTFPKTRNFLLSSE